MTTRITNPHLIRRLSRTLGLAQLQLIGHGVDAIVQHTQRAARPWWARLLRQKPGADPAHIQPTERQRLARYELALFLCKSNDFATRAHRGLLLKRVWKSASCASAQTLHFGPRRSPHRGSPRSPR